MTTVRIEDLYSVSEEEFDAMTHLQIFTGAVLPLISICGFSKVSHGDGSRSVHTASNTWMATSKEILPIDRSQLDVELSWETIKGKA